MVANIKSSKKKNNYQANKNSDSYTHMSTCRNNTFITSIAAPKTRYGSRDGIFQSEPYIYTCGARNSPLSNYSDCSAPHLTAWRGRVQKYCNLQPSNYELECMVFSPWRVMRALIYSVINYLQIRDSLDYGKFALI